MKQMQAQKVQRRKTLRAEGCFGRSLDCGVGRTFQEVGEGAGGWRAGGFPEEVVLEQL